MGDKTKTAGESAQSKPDNITGTFNVAVQNTSSHGIVMVGCTTTSNVMYNVHGTKRRRDIEDGSDLRRLTPPMAKRRRLKEDDGIKIIRRKDLKLIQEIGSGPGYVFHTGKNKGRAVIVKVFNSSPAGRQQLESAVALARELIHANVLQIRGTSSETSSIHFIAYEDVYWKNATGPLAAALKNDLQRSIRLGFKMIAALSAGMNYLSVQGVSLGSMGVENFDIFLDVDDRFVICVHPEQQAEGDATESQEPENYAWTVFNALCHKVFMAANRLLHDQQIHRNPAILDIIRHTSFSEIRAASSLLSFGIPEASQDIHNGELDVSPRREYVWRTMDREQQSLATIAHRISQELEMNLSHLHRLTHTDGVSPHRCVGYVREEIMLATTTLESAVVAHDTPSPLEICSVCHEVVGLDEAFRCICGDPAPGTRHTIKCRVCKLWSHSDCVGQLKRQFTCELCVGADIGNSPDEPMELDLDEMDIDMAIKLFGGTDSDWNAGGPVEESRPLSLTDALNYLAEIKGEFCNQSELYHRFLAIMQDFKSRKQAFRTCPLGLLLMDRRIQTPEVIQRVSLLFNGCPALIQGFNLFLPIGYRVVSSTDGCITVTTPLGFTMQTNKSTESVSDSRWVFSIKPRPWKPLTPLPWVIYYC
ncbi:Paired amphipathic helix protein pst1 [Mycena venus]|uniref:Paired amphipathic helix protein pst1 n=1 Tax=Mycena venus TaxID=2733690 RepID=A0A8H6Y5A6_9AGAR|nr:Paired amphipathic helix protein pst1 [Mycena venus]